MKPQHHPNREDRKKPFYDPEKVEIRSIEDKIAGTIVTSQFTGKATAHTTAIYYQVIFGIFFFEFIIYKLHITQHFLFTSFAGAFTKTPVI